MYSRRFHFHTGGVWCKASARTVIIDGDDTPPRFCSFIPTSHEHIPIPLAHLPPGPESSPTVHRLRDRVDISVDGIGSIFSRRVSD